MTSQARSSAVPIWAAAAAASLLFGVVLVAAPLALGAAAALAAVGALLVAVFTQPRWGLVVALVVLYSYATWVLSHRAGMPDVMVAFLPLLVVIVLVRRFVTGEPVHLPREVGALVVVGLALAASAAFASDTARSAVRLADFVGWALLVIMMASLLDTTRWYRRAVWGIVAAAGALATLTIFQAVTLAYDTDFFGFAKAEGGGDGAIPRSAGPLQPNNFAQILVVAAPLAWYLALSTPSWVARASARAASAACVVAILLTGSRGGLITLVAVFALLIALRPESRKRFLVGGVAALVLALVLAPENSIQRVTAIGSVFGSGVEAADDGALRGRASENLAALRMFRDHPITGVGVANFPVNYLEYSQEIGLDRRARERTPHSLYLEALAEVGVIGTAALLWVLWLAVTGPWRARSRSAGGERLLFEGVFIAVCGYLVAGVFLHGAYPRYLWIVVGLGFAAKRLADTVPPRLTGLEERRRLVLGSVRYGD